MKQILLDGDETNIADKYYLTDMKQTDIIREKNI